MSLHLWALLRAFMQVPRGGVVEDMYMQEMKTLADLEAAVAAHAEDGMFIFKHSTTCPISAAAHRRVSDYLGQQGDQGLPFYLVKVIESRPVSNEIAQRFSVTHQSPQIIYVKGGAAHWNASHGAIDGPAIKRAIEKN